MKAIALCVSTGFLLCILALETDASISSSQQRTLSSIDSLWTAGEREAFWRLLDSELAGARAADDSAYVLGLVLRKGKTQAGLGMAVEAEPALREALHIAGSLKETAIQCESLRWLAVALERRGRPGEAASKWRQLLSLSQKVGNVEHEAWAWTGLGYQDQQDGRAVGAREKYSRALDLFQGCNHNWGAQFASIGLGTALLDLGEYAEALDHYQRASRIAGEKGWSWLEALAINNVAALLFMLGDPGEAREGFLRAHELQTAQGDFAEAVLAGVNVSYCEAELGRYEEAIANLEQTREDCVDQGIGQMEGDVLTALAIIRQRQGHHHLATSLFREILKHDRSLSAQYRVEALVGLSRSLTEIDSLEAALRLMRAESGWSRELDNPKLRVLFDTEMGRLLMESGDASEALSVLLDAERKADHLGLTGHQLSALALSVRAARALELPDSALSLLHKGMQIWELDRGLPADPEWREIRSASAQEIYSQLGGILIDRSTDQTEAAAAGQAFDALQVFKARTLMERMLGPRRSQAPTLAHEPIQCRELRERLLGSGEMLLDYYLGDEESILFAVTQEGCRVVRLPPRRQIEDSISLYYRLLSAPPRTAALAAESKALSEAAVQIRDLLLGSVLDLVGRSQSLVVIPDGIVNLVGFRGLLSVLGDPGDEKQPDRGITIQIAPSATVFGQLRRRERQARGGRPAGSRILALHGGHDAGGKKLSGALEEVYGLRRRFRGVTTEIPLGEASGDSIATREAMIDTVLLAFGQFDVLHFATHATADDQYPWRSKIHVHGIVGREDGLDLFASDIAGCRLHAGLAVLSSCRSACGRILSGEGVQGLASALLSAGVPTVLATLWPVDDRTTTRMMDLFYDALARGRDAATALAMAQDEMRRDPRTSHPFYWAGFIVLGDGGSRPELVARRSIPRYSIPIMLAILGTLGILAPRFHRRSTGRSL